MMTTDLLPLLHLHGVLNFLAARGLNHPILNNLFYYLGLLASGGVFAMPWYTTMAAIKSDQHVRHRSPIAFIVTFLNCLLWAVHGCWPQEHDLIILLNVLGALSQLIYLVKFLSYCDDQERLWWLVYLVPGVLSVICIVAFYASDWQSNTMFFCWACGVTRGLVAVVPLLNLRLVWQQRSMASMPSIKLCLVSLLNAICWAGFACTGEDFDPVIYYPSLGGAGSAALLVALHVALRPTPIADIAQPLVQ